MESSATAGVFTCVVRGTSTLSPKFIIFRSKGTRFIVTDYVIGKMIATGSRVNQLTSWQMCGITYSTISLLIIFDVDRRGLRQCEI
jgi:hypothetical protein